MKRKGNTESMKLSRENEKKESGEALDNDAFQNRLTLQRKVLEKIINPGMRKKIENEGGQFDGAASI